MSNDEINRYIATEIMGKCPHDEKDLRRYINPGRQITERCRACDGLATVKDYCSDDSPRRLLNEVVAKLVYQPPLTPSSSLWQSLGKFARQDAKGDGHHLLLTAKQVATACVEAHKALKTDSVEGK